MSSESSPSSDESSDSTASSDSKKKGSSSAQKQKQLGGFGIKNFLILALKKMFLILHIFKYFNSFSAWLSDQGRVHAFGQCADCQAEQKGLDTPVHFMGGKGIIARIVQCRECIEGNSKIRRIEVHYFGNHTTKTENGGFFSTFFTTKEFRAFFLGGGG